MSKTNVNRYVIGKNRSVKEKEKQTTQNFLTRHLKKIYPIGLRRSSSSISLSSVSLSLSQNSNDSSLTDSSSQLDQKISLALRLITPPERREFPLVTKNYVQPHSNVDSGDEELRRCSWITKNSDKVYVAFHDEQWGVPVYDDNQLFELLAMSSLLMDFNWTEILKRKESLRDSFAAFDPNAVSKMGEKEITEITSNKEMNIAESRVRCIIENAKCILKIVREFGSFGNYTWSYVNHKPVINRFRHSRNVPLRSPKAEAMSKDLVKRGFRYVGPVIIHSFMQAAGLSIDHLVDCYRYSECISLAERPWRHI